MKSLHLLCALALLVAGARANTQAKRWADRDACYKLCMTQGFKPVCVYSPKYPVATSKMPSARWVMPNECAVNCEAKYTKYPEYAILKVAHKASVPSHCAKNVQKIYFDWSLPFSPCVSCK